MTAKVIAFEGLSGVGKTTQTRLVSNYLASHLEVRAIFPFEIPAWSELHNLCYVRHEKFGFSRQSLRGLREIFLRHIWEVGITPHLSTHDVVLLDNPCWADFGLETPFGDFDYMVILTCDGALLPERIRNRGVDAYQVPDRAFAGQAHKAQQQQWFDMYRDNEKVFLIDITDLDIYQVLGQLIHRLKDWLEIADD